MWSVLVQLLRSLVFPNRLESLRDVNPTWKTLNCLESQNRATGGAGLEILGWKMTPDTPAFISLLRESG